MSWYQTLDEKKTQQKFTFPWKSSRSSGQHSHLGHAAPKIWGVSWLGTPSSQIRKGFLEPRILGRWGMKEVVKEERIRKTNWNMPNLPGTQKAIAAIWTHGRAFQKEPEPLGGEKTGYSSGVCVMLLHNFQAPSGTFPTSTVPRSENKPGVTGSECEKRMFGV